MRCRLCGGANIKFFQSSRKYNFDVFMCLDCLVGFRYPMPGKEEVRSFYSEGYYNGTSNYSYIDERKVRGSSLVWCRRLMKLFEIYRFFNGREPNNIVDIGCSFGGLLFEALKLGIKAYGVEISDFSSSYAKRKGIEIFTGNIDEVDLPDDFFDIATMIEVVEHLDNPFESIKKVFGSLRNGGLLLVQTANILGLQSRFWGGNYHYYLPGHLHYFSNKGLRKLLKSVGFSKVLEFYPVEFGVTPKLVKVYLNNEGVNRYLRILKTSLYHILGKIRIGDNCLMSSMVMVGVK